MAQPAGSVETEVRGREAELTPALVAVDHLAGNEPGKAEQHRRVVQASRGQRVADRTGRDRAPVELERSDHVDGKAELAALRRKEIRRAGAVLAEMKVEADHGPADAEPPDQNIADELIRGQARQSCVKGQDDRTIEPGRGEQPQLGVLVGQAKQRLAGMEEGPRMRLEGQHRGRLAEATGAILRSRDHRLMAAMDAVEVAHGDDGAVQRAIGRGIAHDEKAFRRHIDTGWVSIG